MLKLIWFYNFNWVEFKDFHFHCLYDYIDQEIVIAFIQNIHPFVIILLEERFYHGIHLAMAEHSTCQPGLPLPHGDGHDGSPGLLPFHNAKSWEFLFTLLWSWPGKKKQQLTFCQSDNDLSQINPITYKYTLFFRQTNVSVNFCSKVIN